MPGLTQINQPGAARSLRLGQASHDSGSPSGPRISGPPQEPRRQRRPAMAPTARPAMASANSASVTAMTASVVTALQLPAKLSNMMFSRSTPSDSSMLMTATDMLAGPHM